MTTNVRMANKQDKEGIKKLWSEVFVDDSTNFVEWFYENRYNRAFATCLEADGEIASAMQGYPFNLRIRGRIVQASILAGVSTYEKHRGKGFMSKVFKAHMEQIRDAGIPLVPHTPANTPTFFSKGHYPVTETKIVTIKAMDYDSEAKIFPLKDIKSEYGNMFACYTKWSLPYSGIVARSMSDFTLKMADYSADDSKVSILYKGSNVKAYGVFYILPEYIYVEEIAYDSSESLTEMLKKVATLGKEVRAKLPTDSVVNIEGATSKTRLQGVVGVANMSAFLKALFPFIPKDFEDSCIEVVDRIVDTNNGVYKLDGRVVNEKPHITIEAGRLAQVLCGYKTLDEQLEENNVVVHDKAIFDRLNNLLPKEKCFIIDEY